MGRIEGAVSMNNHTKNKFAQVIAKVIAKQLIDKINERDCEEFQARMDKLHDAQSAMWRAQHEVNELARSLAEVFVK